MGCNVKSSLDQALGLEIMFAAISLSLELQSMKKNYDCGRERDEMLLESREGAMM